MIVVTSDKALRRAVKRLTTATGASAQFVENEDEINKSKGIDLAIFDARKRGPSESFFATIPTDARTIYIISPGAVVKAVHLFAAPQTTSLFCYNEQFDDDEFISSATKALRGDVFGLQKYFPWGVTTFSMLIGNYEEKSMAIDIMMDYAQTAGVRGPVRDRLQLVADELMMNAMYHAPTDESGKERNKGKTPKELAQLSDIDPIEVQYGCSGRYFGISVRDGFGSLTRKKALEYLKRAGNRESQIETKTGGAGLGLISVLKSASKLVFNLDPGYSTEVIGLFDMQVQAKGMEGARSLHLFTSMQDEEATSEDEPEEETPKTVITKLPEESRTKEWALAAVLGAVAAALASAFYMQQDTERPPVQIEVEPSVTLVATPSDASVTLNGKEVVAGTPWSIDKSIGTMQIEVSKQGFTTWSKTLNPATLGSDTTLYVELHPE